MRENPIHGKKELNASAKSVDLCQPEQSLQADMNQIFFAICKFSRVMCGSVIKHRTCTV